MPSRTFRSSVKQNLVAQDLRVRAALRNEMRASGADITNWLKIATRGWKQAPRFETELAVRPNRLTLTVNPAGANKKIFIWVDKGTGQHGPARKPYLIPKKVKPGRFLRFRTGYQAKTAPVARINVGSGQRTGSWVKKVRVIHPGIKPRKFTETVVKNLKPSFDRRVDRAIRKALAAR